MKVGQRVRARRRIIESDCRADTKARRCEDGWVHAERGDEGEIIFVSEEDNLPTVRFHRTGTATLVFPKEISLLSQ
jgi:hypothetical protein